MKKYCSNQSKIFLIQENQPTFSVAFPVCYSCQGKNSANLWKMWKCLLVKRPNVMLSANTTTLSDKTKKNFHFELRLKSLQCKGSIGLIKQVFMCPKRWKSCTKKTFQCDRVKFEEAELKKQWEKSVKPSNHNVTKWKRKSKYHHFLCERFFYFQFLSGFFSLEPISPFFPHHFHHYQSCSNSIFSLFDPTPILCL